MSFPKLQDPEASGSAMLEAEREAAKFFPSTLTGKTRSAFDGGFHEHACPGCGNTYEHADRSIIGCGIGECTACFHFRLFPVEDVGGTES